MARVGAVQDEGRGLVGGLAAFFAALIFFLVRRHRHRIDAGEPAVEVHLAAAPRAERAELCVGGFAADRARLSGSFGHGQNMGAAAGRAPLHSGVEPTEMNRIAFAGKQVHRRENQR